MVGCRNRVCLHSALPLQVLDQETLLRMVRISGSRYRRRFFGDQPQRN